MYTKKVLNSGSNSLRLTEAQWEHAFKNVYKNTKQKEACDIKYKFLHLVQSSATKLRGQNRLQKMRRAEETQQH